MGLATKRIGFIERDELVAKDDAAHAEIMRMHGIGIERGERNLTLRSLERIAALIDVDPRKLLD